MTDQPTLKEKTARGLLWGGMAGVLSQLMNAIFGICLLNLLTPNDYGMVQVLAVFSGVAACLQESGFIAALANKKEPTHADYNAVFWFNILCGAVCYAVLFACAPLIARFYNEPQLVALSRFVFLGFFISAFGIAQRAYLFGHLMVRQSAIISTTALLISGACGVAMAWFGMAYWGLAAQSILYVAIIVVMNWWYSPWRPSWNINFRPIREMFGFSSKLLLTSLFGQINRNVLSTLLGRFYDTTTAGYYGNAAKWNDMGSNLIHGMIVGVAQPVLTQVNDDKQRYRQVFRKMLRFASFISFPAMFGLGFVAREFILVTVGPTWLKSASLLSLLSIYGAFIPINTLYANLVVSRGKSNVNLINTVVSCILIWVAMIGLRHYPLEIMVGTFVLINIGWLLVWHYFAWRFVGLRLIDALKDVLPFAAVTLAAIALSWLVTKNIEKPILLLITRIVTTAAGYIGLLYILKAQVLRESIGFLLKKGTTK